MAAYFKDYDTYHSTRGNEVCHELGIPLILISLFGLLSGIVLGPDQILGSPLLRVDGGTLLWAVAALWYLVVDWRVAMPFIFVALAGYFIGRTIPVPVLWAFFVLGWIFQGIGHAVYEKKSPAFFRNLRHVLIGPLWIFVRWTGLR